MILISFSYRAWCPVINIIILIVWIRFRWSQPAYYAMLSVYYRHTGVRTYIIPSFTSVFSMLYYYYLVLLRNYNSYYYMSICYHFIFTLVQYGTEKIICSKYGISYSYFYPYIASPSMTISVVCFTITVRIGQKSKHGPCGHFDCGKLKFVASTLVRDIPSYRPIYGVPGTPCIRYVRIVDVDFFFILTCCVENSFTNWTWRFQIIHTKV